MLVTSLLSALVGIGLLSLDTAQAMGLDEIAQQSGLGEPLRLVIPVLTNAADEVGGEDLAGECFKLVPGAGDKLDDVPQVLAARVALEHRGNRAFLVLTTTRAMNEPVIRVAVQAGCRVSLRREYTVLLDPVTIDTPASAAAVATAEPRNPSVTTSANRQPRAPSSSAEPAATIPCLSAGRTRLRTRGLGLEEFG